MPGPADDTARVMPERMERTRTDAELGRLASFPELNPHPVLEIDAAGQLTYINPSAARLFPDLPARGRAHPLLAGLDLAAGARGRADIPAWGCDVAVGAAVYHLELSAVPNSRRVRLYALDVTARARAEEALRASEERFRSVTQSAHDAIISIDSAGAILSWNAGATAIFGYAEHEALGQPLTLIIPPRYHAAHARGVARLVGGGAPHVIGRPVELQGRRKDGTDVPVELSLATWTTTDGTFFSGIIRDITERKRAEDARRRHARALALRAEVSAALSESTTLRAMLHRCSEATIRHLDAALTRIWLLDERENVLHLQACAGLSTALDGPDARVPVGQQRTGLIAQERRPYLTDDLWSDPHLGANAWMTQQGLVAYAGYPLLVAERVVGVLALCARQPLAADTLDALAAIVDAIAQGIERRRAAEALRHQALHDALTGLPNRTLPHDRLEQALRADARDAGGLALLLFDLDRFKEVNDTLGHQAGDLLLQEVAARVRGAVRASDTVARLGGDEFAVLLPGADAAGAVAATHTLLAALATPIALDGQSLACTASIGIALAPTHGTDVATVLRRADVAMYVAKRAGSGYAVYAAAHDQHSPARLTLETELRAALAAGALVLHYQPTVDVRSGRADRVEALARWPHPQHGLIPPDQFIPLAEQTGLIVPLTQWVLETALAQCHAWEQAGWTLGVAVNLSMRSLHDPGLPETIAWLLRRYAVPPERLTLEITESALMVDPAQAQAVLLRLTALGVQLAIDDFGTGYSSLGYLKQLPVDAVKIDKSFVQNMGHTTTKDSAIVRSIIDLGHNLGLAVVAEGVEDQATWQRLRAAGCDVAQGFYMSRPMPAAELEHWLATTSWGRGAALG